jgi:hypothetical protein
MKRQTLFSILAIILACVPSFAQAGFLQAGAGGQDEAAYFFYRTYVEPAEPSVDKIGGGIMVGKQMHRVLLDGATRSYFGYDVAVERLSGPNMYRVSFTPLSMDRQTLRSFGENVETFKELSAPDWGGAASREIRAGDVLTLTLLTNPRTGQKIVDYVTVKKQSEPPAQLGPLPNGVIDEKGTARDFRVDDAFLNIDPQSATLDGNMIRFPGSVYSALPFFSVPQHGRIVLSLMPQPDLGFRKAGEIRGNRLSVTFEGHTLSVVTNGRIVPGMGPFNVYVLHQPEWKTIGVGGTSFEQLRRSAK